MNDFPYADRYAVNRTLPASGRPRADVLAEMQAMATEEDAFWETGKVSGTMYCGDHEHYDFLGQAFGCSPTSTPSSATCARARPSSRARSSPWRSTCMHAEAVTDGRRARRASSPRAGPARSCTRSSPTGSTPRETRGVTRPNFVKPETGHPAFDKGCHLFGIELRMAPVDPKTTLVDVDAVAELIDDQTIAIMGSACNYAYGTVDPIAELADLARRRGVGMHVDGCLGGFILPFGQELGYDIPVFDFRVPGVTTISADTHKYGYAFKGTSTLLFRDKALRNSQYFLLTDWTGGKYCSPGIEGSRSGGLIAARGRRWCRWAGRATSSTRGRSSRPPPR